jgi:dTDP-4-dehydrorhamnose reductase
VKIVLIGANGQLGSDLFRAFSRSGDEVVSTEHSTFDVCCAEQVEELVDRVRPDSVVNTAAFHKLEECEKKPLRTFEVNAIGALNLARSCAQSRAVLVHFSTDYVFDGQKRVPYEESDLPCPLSVYGTTKVAGEELIACNTERYYIVRTSGLYGHAGSSGKGGNFVETMLKRAANRERISVVDDQILTPTATLDLASMVQRLIDTEAFGLYHVSCADSCSWYQFAREIFALKKIEVDLVPVETRDFASPVKRPPYSVLSKNRLKGLGLSMPEWRDSLERYLRARVGKQQKILGEF